MDVEKQEYEQPFNGIDTSAGNNPDGHEPDEGGEEVTITIGDKEIPHAPEREANWLREMRKRDREQQKEIKRLKAQIGEGGKPEGIPELGKKPTLADFDYDEAKYDEARDAYEARKQIVKAAEAAEADKRSNQEKELRGIIDNYEARKKELNARDFEDSETVCQGELSETQMGLIMQGADNAAVVMYALGKNADELKKLAAIKDPVKFAFAVAKLEGQMKITKTRAGTSPERTPTGSGQTAGLKSRNLEALRAEAQRTGNYNQYLAAKRAAAGK